MEFYAVFLNYLMGIHKCTYKSSTFLRTLGMHFMKFLDTIQSHNSQEHYKYSVISIFLLNSFRKGEGVRG